MNTAEELEPDDEPNVHDLMKELSSSENDLGHTMYGKPLVLFGLPGAFTPTCSKSMLPGYEAMYDQFAELGYEVICVSVNDIYVMKAWFEALGIEKVLGGADGNCFFTERMGMTLGMFDKNMGYRSSRYAIVVNKDGKIEKTFEETDYETSDDPYEVSKPEHVLAWIKEGALA